MALAKRYDPSEQEPALSARWDAEGVYHFDLQSDAPIYSIDTPPPTVSGFLHMGHVYSYSHADFIARYRRMNGDNVYYPMGFDDNGLPTERLVEKQTGKTAEEMGRGAFIEQCLQMSTQYEQEYEALWKRLALSIDWRYTYRTIDDNARALSQASFIDLYEKGYAYRRQAPTIWCPTCHTAIAQAEVNDLHRRSEFVDMTFQLDTGETLAIATTRPELLAACVAVFVHPDDPRYRHLAGHSATVPLFGQEVPILFDPHADPEKGTGAVMCCTFGDTTDIEWWYTHDLPLKEALDRNAHLTALGGPFAGMHVAEAKAATIKALEEAGLLLDRREVVQSVRVHERCDTPVEYIVTSQWFVRVLDNKETFLRRGEEVRWFPEHMKARYREWVEGLSWDWCISRQRYYGVPFPVWYCRACGETVTAERSQLPVDPTESAPARACECGSTELVPEEDVMDTWATSSCSPQIAARRWDDPALWERLHPLSLRPQAHEIIRTWAFDTIVKSEYQFGGIPWRDVLISGWGLAAKGADKISKSRGGGPMAPMTFLERYSADASRYWAASTGIGKDAVISEEKVQAGGKLVTKLWNVARFAERFIEGYRPRETPPDLSPADRWIVARTQRLIREVTASFEEYDYAVAKNEVEVFFWTDLSDNYLEMAKKRLYDAENPFHEGARFALYHVLLAVVKLFAPVLPYVTEAIYLGLFAASDGASSVHRSRWPQPDESLEDALSLRVGGVLKYIATNVRGYKSARQIGLGTEIGVLQIYVASRIVAAALQTSVDDIVSVTRARRVLIETGLEPVHHTEVGILIEEEAQA